MSDTVAVRPELEAFMKSVEQHMKKSMKMPDGSPWRSTTNVAFSMKQLDERMQYLNSRVESLRNKIGVAIQEAMDLSRGTSIVDTTAIEIEAMNVAVLSMVIWDLCRSGTSEKA